MKLLAGVAIGAVVVLVTDAPVGETYWKVKSGIRLTGMPGFEGALSDAALWQVSLLLHEANHLPDAVRAEIR